MFEEFRSTCGHTSCRGLHAGCPFLLKRVNNLVKLVNKNLIDIGVVVLALLPANRCGKANGHLSQRHY